MVPLAHSFNASGPRSWLLWLGLGLLLLGALRIAGVGRRRVPEWIGIVAVLVGVAAAVVGNRHEEPVRPAGPRPVTTGSVRIVDPVEGQTIPGGDTRLRVEVEDFELVEQGVSDSARSGFGHMHITLDGVLAPMPPTVQPEGIRVCVPEGDHTLAVVLVAEDHFGFANESEVSDRIEVSAEAGEC